MVAVAVAVEVVVAATVVTSTEVAALIMQSSKEDIFGRNRTPRVIYL